MRAVRYSAGLLMDRRRRSLASGVRGRWLVPPAAALALVLAAGPIGTSARAPGPTPAAAPPDDRRTGDYRVMHWTTAEGLPQNSVNDLIILSSGEMWVATFGGLARFDGNAFSILDIAADDRLPSNRIVALRTAGPASFLFLTQQGHLGRVDEGQPVLLARSPIASRDFLQLEVDGSGRMYGRMVDGRLWVSDGAGSWDPVPGVAPDLDAPYSIATDADGVLWGASDRGLSRLPTGRGGDPIPVSVPDPRRLASRTGGGLWIVQGDGLSRFVGGRVERQVIDPPPAGVISAIDDGADGSLWIATPGDVSRLDPRPDGTWLRTSLPLGLSPIDGVQVLHDDGAGALWIGTDGRGLYRVSRMPIRRLETDPRNRGVAGLAADGTGGAWVASGCLRILHLDPSGERLLLDLNEFRSSPQLSNCGASLSSGPGGSVWIRTGPDLNRIPNGTTIVRRVTRNLPPEEGPIVAAADGSLWVVSRSGRVQAVSADGRVTRELSLPARLYSAALGPDGALWIGGGDGEVFRILDDAVDRFGPEAQVPRGLIRDILVDPDGTAWIGSYGGGIGRLRAGRVARLTVDQGLPDNAISRLLVDRSGRLWISTNRGIAIVDRDRLEAVADGRERSLSPVVLGVDRGVPEANFGSPAGFADANGRLWFGTIDGVVVLDATRFPEDTTPLPAHIEAVRADDRALALDPVVRVPPLTARVRVAFTAFDLHHAEQVRFRFRFEGSDPDWIDAGGARYVDWTPPSPGRYRFLVEARNRDGVWSRSPTSLVIDVLPAWWQTTLARAAAVLGLLLVGTIVVRRRLSAIEGRHAARVRALEDQRRAEERLVSMRAQLERVSRAALAGELTASIAHEVGQPVGAIVNNAEAGRRHLDEYLRRPDDLRHLLGDIVDDAMRASEVIKGLRGFLQPRGADAAPIDLSDVVEEALPLVRREIQDHHALVELTLASDLPPVEGLRVQLSQIVVNLVVNACEALSHVEHERRIRISTVRAGDRVELAVCDNGPGVDPAVAPRLFDPFVTTKPGGLGVGLAVCRSIAERHGGRLTAAAGPDGTGACLTLSLPASGPNGSPS
ncbi:MAG: two-component regulator propeller domain-containing protein [Vicinamibacterales bacterium]